jgi:NADPH-dependent curcumin reductase
MENQRILLAERPRYIVPTANCFRLDTAEVPQTGEVLLQTLWLAMESTLYARVQRITKIQRDPIALGQPMQGSAVGRVIESRHPRFQKGDLASGQWGWQNYDAVPGDRLRNLDFGPQRPSYALGAFGLSGFTAYIALDTLAPPTPGKTVVTGTALGSLGHIAGQIAKLKGARVVGIAGSAEKCQLAVEKLGFDACVNRQAKDFEDQLRDACPKGVSVYLETLGGRALNAVMPLMRVNARIVAIGQAATPHHGEKPFAGPYQNTLQFMQEVIARRISVHGLIGSDHVKGRVKAFDEQMKAWIDAGQVKPMEDIVSGLAQAPEAFQGVFEGANRGTRLVRVAD